MPGVHAVTIGKWKENGLAFAAMHLRWKTVDWWRSLKVLSEPNLPSDVVLMCNSGDFDIGSLVKPCGIDSPRAMILYNKLSGSWEEAG
jgi:hypothetical protein